MPAKACWLLHVPEIIEQLELFKVPVVDRAIIEVVFALGRRQAIEFPPSIRRISSRPDLPN
jgi:hypothetical protein